MAASTVGKPTASRARTRGGVGDCSDLCEVQVINRQKVNTARAALPSTPILAGLTEMLRALGDPTRLQIVLALATVGVYELCVCDLATLVEVSDSAVSHSLRTLRELGVVRYRKVGKIAYYSLDDAHVGELVREGVRHMERTR
jgi:DNA-binding transcriptional ArsR family regulator